jgi:hypothetical protein
MSEGTTGGAPASTESAPPKTEASPPAPPASPQGETTFTQADLERIVNERITRERKKYADYGDLKEQATKAKTVEDQLQELRKQITDRDVADVEKNGRLALAQVKAQVIGAGFKPEDVAGLFDHIDPMSLISDGEPDEKAIEKLAKSLTKVAGRATPDPDQGRRGGDGPVDMNTLIRRAAGVIT